MIKEELKKLLLNSYAKYSKYEVSAIIETIDNNLISGVNVENISFPSTMCAERVSLFSSITKGYKKGDFKAIYVMSNSLEIPNVCFGCRQVLKEFFEDENIVVCMNIEGKEKTFTIKELCPHPFESEEL